MSAIASPPLFHRPVELARARDRASLARTGLLVCGIVASLLYVIADVVAATRWGGYRYAAQTISELSALGAPTRPLLVPIYLAYDLLLIAFGAGVWMSGRTRALRVIASSLFVIAAVGLVWTPLFPMHLRGATPTLTDTMHIACTGVVSLFILVAIGFGSTLDGARFRVYSIGTILMLLVCGGLTGLAATGIAANQPTPWIGITERINVFGYTLWMLVLAIVLLRRGRPARAS